MNRSQQPPLLSVDKINFVEPERYVISPGVHLFHMKDVPNETSKFDLYFDAGKCRGTDSIPSLVNGLLLSGTELKSSVEINEAINGLGGFYEAGLAMESSVVSLYALRENLFEIFDIVIDAIKHVAFHEKEVKQLLSERKQKLRISLQKVSVLAQREFQKHLFASNPLYSQVLLEKDLKNASIDRLREFHKRSYLQGLTKVVVIGDIDPSTIKKIIELCKELTTPYEESLEHTIKNDTGRFHIDKKDAMQTALRVGRPMFNKNHDDYIDFLVLNTLLGDYFGSRLMSNIREDKGYTYGIGSMLAEYKNTGYFMIGTEVGKNVHEEALKEIRSELERLQSEEVRVEELDLVRNYMLGQLLKSADGPYAMTDLFLSAEIHGKPMDFYNDVIARIRNIKPERIQELARKYLSWDEMTVISAG